MRISVLCSDPGHPVHRELENWCARRRGEHEVELVHRTQELSGGDLLFLISCNEIVRAEVRQRYRASLVVHASDLPRGRGWSPLIWQIINGENVVTVSLLETEDKVDTGAIWGKRELRFDGHELADEINTALFTTELELIDMAVEGMDRITPQPQGDGEATYYRKRTPEDSRIDPTRSLAEQFDLLRVADPQRYPAFFDHRGHRYKIILRKVR